MKTKTGKGTENKTDVESILKELTGDGIKGCYLLYGEDEYTRRKAEERLKRAVVDEASEMMNLSVFSDVKTTAGQIIEAAETMPFLSDRRFILAKDCGFFSEGKKAETELLAEYIPQIPDTACVVFSETAPDKRMKLYKAVDKNGRTAEFKKLGEAGLADLAEKKLTESGLRISKGMCVYLARNCSDGEMLNNECEKLISFMGERKEVTSADIDAVGAKNTETKVFDLVDAMITGKTEKALEIYRNMLAVNESPIMVLSLISRQFRIMLKCKSLSQSGYSENDMAAKIGVNPYAAKIALRQSRSFGYDIIEQMLNRCIETDYSIKSGALNAETGVELVIAMGIE